VADARLRKPHLSDIARLIDGVRRADLNEMHACGLYDPRAVIEKSLHDSTLSWAASVDGELAFLCGVAPWGGALLSEVGVPWLIGTDLVAKNARTLMRLAPSYIDQMLRAYPRLVNFVHAENTQAVTWLQRMGFSLEPAIPHGPYRALFRRFEMNAHAAGPDASPR